MDKNEILVPILTAINDLREDVRENRREIQKNREAIQKNAEAIKENKDAIQSNKQSIASLASRIERLEEQYERNRKEILNALFSYEQVTNIQYEENKNRIEKLEKRMEIISA